MAGNYVKLLLLFAFMFSFTISDEFCSRRLVGGKWITRGDCGITVSTEATVLKELKGSIPCRERKAPRNGVMNGTKTQYMPGDVISFKCNVGYRLKGKSEDTCQPRGIWANNKTPTCVLITCGERLAPTSGSIEGIKTRYLLGDRIKFTCKKLYKLEGTEADTCKDDGSWDVDVTPKCIRITCPQREAPIGGGISGQANQYLPGDVITFTCGDFSGILEGAQRDFCQSDGSWRYKATPKCTVTSFLCAASSGLYYRGKCYTIPSHVPTELRLKPGGAEAQCSKTGSSLVEIFDQAQQNALSDFILTKLPFGTSKYDINVWTAMEYQSSTNTIVYRSGQTVERSRLSWRTGYPSSLSRSPYLLLKVSSKSSGNSPGIWNFQYRYTANAILCEK